MSGTEEALAQVQAVNERLQNTLSTCKKLGDDLTTQREENNRKAATIEALAFTLLSYMKTNGAAELEVKVIDLIALQADGYHLHIEQDHKTNTITYKVQQDRTLHEAFENEQRRKNDGSSPRQNRVIEPRRGQSDSETPVSAGERKEPDRVTE